jgi:hypothetical protein
MITPKIKALFQFIEYLHSNIESFSQYSGLIKELEALKDIKNKLKPEQSYKDKLQYNKVQAELESKFKLLQDNTANLIKAKAKELNICNFDNEPNYSFNGIETEIRQLKENFSDKDLPEIFKYKSQYLEYRSNTHGTFLSLQFFFDELDEITKSLFDYFKDTEQNEFEAFETKAIQANDIGEAVKLIQQGHKKITLPISILNPLNVQQNKVEALPPQQRETKTEQETPKTFIANEYALAYIFDLYASGKQIPANRIDGGYDKKELIKKGFELYQFDEKKDTFYRAVKHVANFNLNKKQDLASISRNYLKTGTKPKSI